MKTYVTKHTRAGKKGRHIVCPKCAFRNLVYHFAWSAKTCQNCKTMVDKTDWRLPE